jgi:pimeloyl-ACP methyl ester carboxylesterase
VRRLLLPALAPALTAGALAAVVAPATAAVPFHRCSGESQGALCARVTVPLDRSGATPGTLRLLVQRVPDRPRRADVLLVLAGGPGQAATPLREEIEAALAPALGARELVVFDQRGTGAGALRCPTVEGPEVRDETGAVAACAARLGASSSHFTTRDSVEDIDAVRDALGAQRISLLGVSYGTKVALGYAVAHPDRVDRLVLDSPVALDGPDPFGRSGLAALPRVLADLCRGRRCRGVTGDPLGDLGRLAGRLRAGPLRGTVIGPHGQRRRSTLRESGLLGLLLASDVDPTLLPALPAATRSALRGDGAPLLRLAKTAAAAEAPERPSEFSTALLVATLCEESAFPWSRGASVDQRRAELGAAVESLGDAPFAPFGRAAAVAVSIMPACLAWPAASAAPSLAGAAPGAPTMLLDGTSDLRTPLEDGRAIAATLPDARLLEATGVGHSVISTATSKCPGRALGAFFAGRPVRRTCPRDRLLDIPPDPIAPLSLREVGRPAGLGGRPGRTLGAVLLTFADTGAALLAQLPSAIAEIVERGTASAGGLRGGYVSLGVDGIRLHHAVYVPGVIVDGGIRFVSSGAGLAATFRVSGPAASHGIVRLLPDGTTSGRLAGRRFHLRPSGLAAVSGVAGARSPAATVARLRRLLERPRGLRTIGTWRPGA